MQSDNVRIYLLWCLLCVSSQRPALVHAAHLACFKTSPNWSTMCRVWRHVSTHASRVADPLCKIVGKFCTDVSPHVYRKKESALGGRACVFLSIWDIVGHWHFAVLDKVSVCMYIKYVCIQKGDIWHPWSRKSISWYAGTSSESTGLILLSRPDVLWRYFILLCSINSHVWLPSYLVIQLSRRCLCISSAVVF